MFLGFENYLEKSKRRKIKKKKRRNIYIVSATLVFVSLLSATHSFPAVHRCFATHRKLNN